MVYVYRGIMYKRACSVSGNITGIQPVDPRSIRGVHICFFVKASWGSGHPIALITQSRLFNSGRC
jgi:hypothetical protein